MTTMWEEGYRGFNHHATTHGDTGSAEHGIWANMLQRCYNPNDQHYPNYGGRGIIVCKEWHDYAPFLVYMGRRPSPKYTLGRKDNNGDYTPDNCEWQTRKQQGRNRRDTKLTIAIAREIRMQHSRGYSQKELAEEFEVSQSLISLIINNKRWEEE